MQLNHFLKTSQRWELSHDLSCLSHRVLQTALKDIKAENRTFPKCPNFDFRNPSSRSGYVPDLLHDFL